MTTAFLACVECGELESQTVLLCRSIRRNAGRYCDAPIFTFQPRLGTTIDGKTLRDLKSLGVHHIAETLNRQFDHYAIGNKIFVSAWAEENLAEDVLVFVDSDTIFTGEPAGFDLPCGVDAAIRAAHSLSLNSSGPDDPKDGYWRRVYEFCGLKDEPYVETELGNRVRAYFSSGLIAVRRCAGIMQAWRSTFLELVRAGICPLDSGINRMDEISLAACLAGRFERVTLLDGRYNYLIYRRTRLLPPWRSAEFSDLIHIHYRSSFHQPGFLRSVQPAFDNTSEIFVWLEHFLPLKPIHHAAASGAAQS